MNWQAVVERTVTGLGYDLVDAEKSAGGLLRVYIDRLAGDAAAAQFITVDDCEKVTRQLQYVLEVESCAYERLEVSSPGLDRPLKKPADYLRFAGEQIELTLKMPFKGRKKYRGELQAAGDGWRLLLADAAAPLKKVASKAGKAATAKPGGDTELALDFAIEEVREARLVPVLDFKGRRFAPQGAASPETAPGPAGRSMNEIDGGRIQ